MLELHAQARSVAPHRLARLKRVAIFPIRSLRFSSVFYRMSLSQNRRTVLRDML